MVVTWHAHCGSVTTGEDTQPSALPFPCRKPSALRGGSAPDEEPSAGRLAVTPAEEGAGCAALSLVDYPPGRATSSVFLHQPELTVGLVECDSGIFGQLDH